MSIWLVWLIGNHKFQFSEILFPCISLTDQNDQNAVCGDKG